MRELSVAIVVGLALTIVPGCGDDSSAEPVTIIPIGDSLTDRVGFGTYRCYLDTMLAEAGVEFDFVGSFDPPASSYACPSEFDREHEAVSGASIDTRAGAAVDSVERLQPDVALVLLGTADLRRQPSDEAAEELATMIKDMQAVSADLAVLVAQYPPCRSSSSWCTDSTPEFNEAIGDFGRLSTDRSPVVVVDMYTGFSLDHLHDSVHPNAAGDEEMARRWMAALAETGAIEITTEAG